MESTLLKKLPKGEFFKLKGSETAPVWTIDYRDGHHIHAHKFDDINHTKVFKQNKIVFFGFEF